MANIYATWPPIFVSNGPFKSWAVHCKHLYISELRFHLILYQYLIIRTFLITVKGNLANSPYIVGLEVLE
mgnify:CR=1 FL=1